ncbi:hypothetical protein CIPAW_10G003600 [Carya illinoinensis]|uniref:Secreted protein n=1 Tax=Carya illinoinensis TaxID=32201 RepID=A0A8T1P9J0_CARIL|nr:hypothetical protein CIPAW_10G003600 [Carya illinoinensis]
MAVTEAIYLIRCITILLHLLYKAVGTSKEISIGFLNLLAGQGKGIHSRQKWNTKVREHIRTTKTYKRLHSLKQQMPFRCISCMIKSHLMSSWDH